MKFVVECIKKCDGISIGKKYKVLSLNDCGDNSYKILDDNSICNKYDPKLFKIIIDNRTLKEKFLHIVSSEPSKWQEQADWRIENKDWIRISQKIAIKLLSTLNDINLNKHELSMFSNISIISINKMLKGSYNFSIKEITFLENFLNVKLL